MYVMRIIYGIIHVHGITEISSAWSEIHPVHLFNRFFVIDKKRLMTVKNFGTYIVNKTIGESSGG